MSLRPKNIVWLDLETTGNQADDQILEVGVIVTDMGLNVLDKCVELNPNPVFNLKVFDIDPVVLAMHAESGLWKDLREARIQTIEQIDNALADWLVEINGGTQHMAFAGSGVGHFDRQYIKKYMPQTNDLLTYWALDVGVTRRMASLAQLDADLLHEFTTLKPHRALDDAWLALEEARAWVNRERELRNLAPWTFSDEPSDP